MSDFLILIVPNSQMAEAELIRLLPADNESRLLKDGSIGFVVSQDELRLVTNELNCNGFSCEAK